MVNKWSSLKLPKNEVFDVVFIFVIMFCLVSTRKKVVIVNSRDMLILCFIYVYVLVIC